MMKNQLAGLMKQAQAMQDNMKKAQDQLALVEVEGQSGAGPFGYDRFNGISGGSGYECGDGK